MKKLFLILLILPIGLLADDWIFNVENTTMVTAYFNIFNAIAALFKNDSYIDLLRLAFLIGGFFVFAKGVLAAWEGSASANMLSPYGKYLAIGVALLTLIFSTTSTLWIEAKELPTYCPGAATGTPSTTGFAVELPSVLAYVFKFTNTIGTELTYLAEAAFTNPSNPAGSAAMSDSDGYLGSLKATIGLLTINPSYVTLSKDDALTAEKATDFVQDFRMFYQSCVTQNNQNQGAEGREQDYKIMSAKNIMKEIDAYIGSDSPDTGFQFNSEKYPGNVYTNIYGVPKTCRAVWANLKSTEGAIAKFTSKMCSVYPKINGGVFELITGTHGSGNAMEITDIGLQAGLINAIKSSNKYDGIGIQGGGSFTSGESRAVTNLEQLSTASYMAEMIPYLQMTMRAVLYAFFPFVFVVILLPGGLAVLTQYLQTMIWIELWTPTAAIVNMFINLRIKDTVGVEYSKQGLTLMTSANMLSEANTIAGVGAVLYLSIPPLTWLILKGSGQMLGGMLSSHSSGFTKHLDENRRTGTNDLHKMQAIKTINDERLGNKEKALSYAEAMEYEARQTGTQLGSKQLASMESGLQAEKSSAFQSVRSELEGALNAKAITGSDKKVGDVNALAKAQTVSENQALQEKRNYSDLNNMKADSANKANEADIKLETDAALQKEFSNKFRAVTDANERITKILGDSKFQEKYGNMDRATQDLMARIYAHESSVGQFNNDANEARTQGTTFGVGKAYANDADKNYQNQISREEHGKTKGDINAKNTKIEKKILDDFGGVKGLVALQGFEQAQQLYKTTGSIKGYEKAGENLKNSDNPIIKGIVNEAKELEIESNSALAAYAESRLGTENSGNLAAQQNASFTEIMRLGLDASKVGTDAGGTAGASAKAREDLIDIIGQENYDLLRNANAVIGQGGQIGMAAAATVAAITGYGTSVVKGRMLSNEKAAVDQKLNNRMDRLKELDKTFEGSKMNPIQKEEYNRVKAEANDLLNKSKSLHKELGSNLSSKFASKKMMGRGAAIAGIGVAVAANSEYVGAAIDAVSSAASPVLSLFTPTTMGDGEIPTFNSKEEADEFSAHQSQLVKYKEMEKLL